MSRARRALAATAFIILAAGASIAYLRAREDRIVFATPRSHEGLMTQLPPNTERVSVESDGIELRALTFQTAPDDDSGYWILHLHGNGESAFSPRQIRHCEALRSLGFNVLALDYRGYGDSPGVPNEPGVYDDAEAAYQVLRARGVPDDRIILWGHSLGSAPAVHLATRHQVAALVLFSAFTSMPEAVALRYSMQPLWKAIGVQFDSLSLVGTLHVPLIIAGSRSDAVIPYAHAVKLYEAANQPKVLLSLEAAPGSELGGHSDALYENLDVLKKALKTMLPALERT
jgi:uncharacterized protein